MPTYDRVLLQHVTAALGITGAGESAHNAPSAAVREEWPIHRLEALYELAFLRVFAAWEMCLESIFYRSLCGYASSAGQEVLRSGAPYFSKVQSAEQHVLAGSAYKLWHNPHQVIARCQGHFGNTGPRLQETVISSNLARLEHFGATRHRIVHTHQKDARNNFDNATMTINGKHYAGSRPGKFLRDWEPVPRYGGRRRWLDVIALELVGLTRQMA